MKPNQRPPKLPYEEPRLSTLTTLHPKVTTTATGLRIYSPTGEYTPTSQLNTITYTALSILLATKSYQSYFDLTHDIVRIQLTESETLGSVLTNARLYPHTLPTNPLKTTRQLRVDPPGAATSLRCLTPIYSMSWTANPSGSAKVSRHLKPAKSASRTARLRISCTTLKGCRRRVIRC